MICCEGDILGFRGGGGQVWFYLGVFGREVIICGVDGLRGLLDLGGSLGRQVRLGLVRLDQSD